MDMGRLKNRLIAKLLTAVPWLAGKSIAKVDAVSNEDIPWTPAAKPLSECRVALLTTAGVHHKDQRPFDMLDKEGDPTLRVIDVQSPVSDLMITHDYYDHTDADRDINIVFPIERLREFEAAGVIGGLTRRHYGLMGHITGPHIPTLINKTSPEIIAMLREDGADAVLLTPG